jgi:hypothetical protein
MATARIEMVRYSGNRQPDGREGMGMEVVGTVLAGTVAGPLADLLLDAIAAVANLAWLLLSVLLELRSGAQIAPDPPPPAARAGRPALVVDPDPDGIAFVPRQAA